MSTPHSPVGGAVLVVYPFCLDHVGHGNIQRILAVARYLAMRGMAVDLVYQASARVARAEGQYAAFRHVFAVEPGATSSDAAACAARLQSFYGGHELPPVHMRPSAPLTALVRGLIEAGAYRAVLATYAFTAPIFSGLRRRVFTICDVQDVMHEHADACQKATGQASSFTMPPATEAFLWRQWDALIAITPDDQVRIARDVLPGQHVLSARHAAPCATTPAPGSDDVALYAASDNQSNVASVTWLLEHVWPRVRAQRPHARLRMAGLICAALPTHLRDTPGLELLGFCDDLSGELSRCGVLVAPYRYGSGLKIKVVEAACAGKAVVTTSSGLAGSGLVAGRALEVHDEAAPYADAGRPGGAGHAGHHGAPRRRGAVLRRSVLRADRVPVAIVRH
jgi:Glycosyl transferases group 1